MVVAPPVAEFIVAVRPHPLRNDTHSARVPVGCTLAEMGAGGQVLAFVDGLQVEDTSYAPTEGQIVVLQATAAGSNGGKMALRLVAALAITYFSAGAGAWAAGPSGFGIGSAGVWGAGFSLAGNLALNALIPPPTQKFDASAKAFTPFHQLTNSNQANPFGVIPRLYGTHRIFPALASFPHTEQSGADQYLRLLFCLGYGPLTIDADSFKLGDTALSEYEGEYEIREGTPTDQPITLFSRNVVETQVGFDTQNDGDSFVQTLNGATDISLDFFAPALLHTTEKGHTRAVSVGIKIEYRLHGASAWAAVSPANASVSGDGGFCSNYPFLDAADGGDGEFITVFKGSSAGITDGNNPTNEPCFYIMGSAAQAFFLNVTLHIPAPGDYDIRITRVAAYHFIKEYVYTSPEGARIGGADRDAGKQDDTYNAVTWRTAQSIGGDVSQNLPAGYAYVAMRLKATGQLSGSVNDFSCVATSRLKAWSGTAWVEQETSNPAWICRDILVSERGWGSVAVRVPPADPSVRKMRPAA